MKCYPPEMLMMRKVFKSSLRKILRFPGAAAKSPRACRTAGPYLGLFSPRSLQISLRWMLCPLSPNL